MKANPRRVALSPAFPLAQRRYVAPLTMVLALAACVPPPAGGPGAPASSGTQAPPRHSQPRHSEPRQAPPLQSPQRPAPSPPRASSDWRDVPATAGDWQWSQGPAGASASFAGGLLSLRCNRAASTVSLVRASAGPAGDGPVTITVTTTDSARNLPAARISGGIETTLPSRDRLLDEMAFSRGRFAYAAAGTPTLYVPSWTEISRVVEDCR